MMNNDKYINPLVLKKAADIVKRKNQIIAQKKDMTTLDMVDLIKRASLTITQDEDGINHAFKMKPKLKRKITV
jgi:hypothetical protein